MNTVIRWVVIGLVGTGVLAGLAFNRAQATSVVDPVAQPPSPDSDLINQQCLECHAQPKLTMPLPNGDFLYLALDSTAFTTSLHGQASLACTDCHTTITGYPHPALEAQNFREIASDFSQTCQACHADQATKQMDSIHQQARERGDENAAVCSDCHDPHNTTLPQAPRSKIVATCGRCHSGIAQDYGQSVHGTALLQEENSDVPSCIDCHGVHNIPNPLTAQFLLNSPQMCAECHTDSQKMAKYDLNTGVLNTYVADFHGTTTTLFETQAPDQVPNKPLCIDCHGTHNIKSTQDPDSQVIKQNLLATCQKCHPNASANFSGAWLSHYTPSLQHTPLVYLAGVIYQVLIPVVIGGMVLFVTVDARHRFFRRRPGERQRGQKESK